ncbi:hypothetical protein D3C85_1253450 [compost metagenome]
MAGARERHQARQHGRTGGQCSIEIEVLHLADQFLRGKSQAKIAQALRKSVSPVGNETASVGQNDFDVRIFGRYSIRQQAQCRAGRIKRIIRRGARNARDKFQLGLSWVYEHDSLVGFQSLPDRIEVGVAQVETVVI